MFSTKITKAKNYIIYSVVQDLPMGEDNEVIKKNYYINMGNNHGLEKGSVLDVFRVISRIDPYETKKRYKYKVKIAEVKVLHAEDESSIATLLEINNKASAPLFEIPALMIGDRVDVKIE